LQLADDILDVTKIESSSLKSFKRAVGSSSHWSENYFLPVGIVSHEAY